MVLFSFQRTPAFLDWKTLTSSSESTVPHLRVSSELFFFLFLLWWAFVLSLDLLDNLGFLSSSQSHLILNLDSSHSFVFPLLYDLAHSKALEIWLPQSPLGISHLPPSLNSCYQLPVFPLVLTWKQHQHREPERICFQGTHQVPRPWPDGWAPCSLPWPHPHCCPIPQSFPVFHQNMNASPWPERTCLSPVGHVGTLPATLVIIVLTALNGY